LDDDEEAANSLLEAPEPNDSAAVEFFYKIQKQVEETVSKEEQSMEQNIKNYIQEQRELLREFQIKAYKDRKILWNKISRVIHSPNTSNESPPKNVVIQDYNPSIQTFPSTQPSIIPKQNIDQPAPKIGLKTSSNTAAFTKEDTKKDDIKKEEIKKDDVNKDEVKKDEVKKEDTKKRRNKER